MKHDVIQDYQASWFKCPSTLKRAPNAEPSGVPRLRNSSLKIRVSRAAHGPFLRMQF